MSELVLDTITGKSTATTITIGSTPVVSASANSMTIRGEGSNQTSIQQGLAKCWYNLDGTGTIALNNSFNVSGIVDTNPGDYVMSYTTNMANATSAVILGGASQSHVGSTASGTTSHAIRCRGNDDADLDLDPLFGEILGDLA